MTHAPLRLMGLCLALLGITALRAPGSPDAPGTSADSPREELSEVFQWLLNNPPDGSNRDDRRVRMAAIQAAADRLSPEDYWSYETAWYEDAGRADQMERQGVLSYLAEATNHAIASIRDTEVKQGVAVWHLYNMGYVFKTPEACFGIDPHVRHAAALAGVLDFVLVTHEHNDHYSKGLMDAMLQANKPVITRWYPGSTVLDGPAGMRFDAVRVRVDIGDHHWDDPDQRDNMLMFQVDCGPAGNDCTIYHSGDGSNFQKMSPDRDVDIFIVHVEVGMDVAEAMRHLRARRTFVSHVLELGHSPNPPHAWRWSFDYAFDRVKEFPEDEAMVLTWGERWLLPGTILAASDERDRAEQVCPPPS